MRDGRGSGVMGNAPVYRFYDRREMKPLYATDSARDEDNAWRIFFHYMALLGVEVRKEQVILVVDVEVAGG